MSVPYFLQTLFTKTCHELSWPMLMFANPCPEGTISINFYLSFHYANKDKYEYIFISLLYYSIHTVLDFFFHLIYFDTFIVVYKWSLHIFK